MQLILIYNLVAVIYNLVGYTTDYVANTWVHTHEEHPDKSFELNSKEAKDLILRLVAEQNADIAEEMGGLREGIKSD